MEEQFYLLGPAMFLLWKHRLANLSKVLCAVIVLFWIYRAILKFGFGVDQRYFYEAFDARADHLLIGCLLAFALWSARFNNRWQTMTGPWQPAVTISGLIVSVLLEFHYRDTYRDSISFIVNPILAAMLIVQLISCRNMRALAWMRSAPVRYLGRISYSLYLYQQLVLPVFAKITANLPRLPGLVLSIAVLVAVAGTP